MKYLFSLLMLLSTFYAICQDKVINNPTLDTTVVSKAENSYLSLNKNGLISLKKGDFFDSIKLVHPTPLNVSSSLKPLSSYQINLRKKNINPLLGYYSLTSSTNQSTSIFSSKFIDGLAEVKPINLYEIPLGKLQKEAAMYLKIERDKQQMELYQDGRDLFPQTFELFKIESRNARKKN